MRASLFARAWCIVFSALVASCHADEAPPRATPMATAAPMRFAVPTEHVPVGRLPNDVRPSHYTLSLEIVPERERFTGTVEIAIDLDKPRSVIWLHGKNIHAKEASVRQEGRGPIAARFDIVHPSGVAALRLAEPVGPGHATIHIDFDAPFGERLEGLYKVRTGGQSYSFTQFEATSARQAFPCFDEPAFKTPFDVTLAVPETQEAIANTHGLEHKSISGLKRVTFATTEKLPTYLVAFATGPLDIVDAPPVPANAVRKRPLPLRGIAAKGRGKEFAYGLAHTGEILAAIEEYTGIPYPYDKLDMIAVPDRQGAMENPGAVTFREWLLLVDDKTATINQRRAYYYVVAHELAHQWFGDLVTMPWWDDTWLNEAFATWMGNKIATKLRPDLDMDASALDRVHGAMEVDGLASARQIRQEVRDGNDIANAFDAITYQKGGAVLAMFERSVGDVPFRGGLHDYLEQHRFGNATADDLLRALSKAAGRDVATPFQSFIGQPGIPLVEATLLCGRKATLHLKQARYLPLGSTGDTKSRWQIPVCARYPVGKALKVSCTLLTEREGDIPFDGDECPPWVHPNADAAGYYRFSLPAAEVKKLAHGFGKLNERERMSFAMSLRGEFARGTLSATDVLPALGRFASDTSRPVAVAPIGVLDAIADWFQGDALLARVRAYGGGLYAPVYKELGFDAKAGANESVDRKLLRAAVVQHLAISARDADVRKEAATRGRAYVGFGSDGRIHTEAIDPNLAGIALQVAVEDGEPALFDALAQKLKTVDDETVRGQILWALGSAKTPELSERAREMAFDTELRGNEWATTLEAQFASLDTRDAAWEFMKARIDPLIARTSPERAAHLIDFASRFCDRTHAEELTRLFEPRVATLEGAPRVLANALEAIRLCSARRVAQEPSARVFFAVKPKKSR